jgi:hypothetical protein
MTDRALPPEPEQYQGRDSEVEYLIEVWRDGTVTLATRPIGGARWSAPVILRGAS